jgi:hypothetical protein
VLLIEQQQLTTLATGPRRQRLLGAVGNGLLVLQPQPEILSGVGT